jgi:hypothetical protein
MVSYYFWLREQSFDQPVVALAKSLDFGGFALNKPVLASFRGAPAGHYVTDAAGRERPAHFLRLEDFPQSLTPLEAHLGFSLDLGTRVNASTRDRDYKSYYTDAMRDAVAEACAVDIARFGYAF